jgi:hypothetical protein
MFLFHIFANFFTAIPKERKRKTEDASDEQNLYEDDFSLIFWDYLKFYFILDVLACIPSLATSNMDRNYFKFKWFKVFIIPRLYVKSEFLKKEMLNFFSSRNTVSNVFHFLTIIVSLLTLIHFMACVWIRVGIAEIEG